MTVEDIELLYGYDGLTITASLLGCLILAAVGGFRIGRYFSRGVKSELQSQVQTIEAAMLTLLGLLLAFTFSIAASRFDERKQVILQEANAMSTTYLRASLLPEPKLTQQFRSMLRQYLDLRIQVYQRYMDSDAQQDNAAKTTMLQKKLWSIVSESSRNQPTYVAMSLVAQAINDLIDLSETQRTRFDNHVPEQILLFLFGLSIVVIGTVSYMNGLSLDRPPPLTFLLSAIFAMTVFLLIDLDRPHRGLIRINAASLDRVKALMDHEAPNH